MLAPVADPNIGREIANQFRIVEKIGSGGMGSVYKAEQPDMRRFVAIKILHPRYLSRPDLVSRFRREARAMSHLTHPNTAKVFLYGQLEDGSCYFAMEYLEGRNLAQTVRAEGPMEVERAIHVMVQACGALEEAHTKGIIHRDLKPENIFLTNLGGIPDFPKVLDFGLAKVTEREMRPGSLILTQEGMVFGTPEFMSPEQARGEKLDSRSDIYSLGVILYELLTGKLPFDAAQPMEFIQKHIKEQPIPLSQRMPNREFPPGLWDAIAKCLAKAPAQRHQSASEMAQALKAVLSHGRAMNGAAHANREPTGAPPSGGPPKHQYVATQMGFNPSPYAQPHPGSVSAFPRPDQPVPAQPGFLSQVAQQPPQPFGANVVAPGFGPQAPGNTGGYPHASPYPENGAHFVPASAPSSKTPWIVLGIGATLALVGTLALIVALWLR
jgi:serine/threonine-protein kinase